MQKIKDKIVLVLFGSIMVTVVAVVGYFVILTAVAQQVVVAITGYDPRDLLSGRYIEYVIDWDNTDCSQFSDAVCPKDEFPQRSRFYVPEAYADNLDRLFASRGQELQFAVVYAYARGHRPVAKELLINGAGFRLHPQVSGR
ncbi:MAG: hypothetical protein FWF01_01990 [Alphaproteobacteria bacterium]|nr:hypothetical protein [Alphaproteobacteria bacterium]